MVLVVVRTHHTTPLHVVNENVYIPENFHKSSRAGGSTHHHEGGMVVTPAVVAIAALEFYISTAGRAHLINTCRFNGPPHPELCVASNYKDRADGGKKVFWRARALGAKRGLQLRATELFTKKGEEEKGIPRFPLFLQTALMTAEIAPGTAGKNELIVIPIVVVVV